MKSRVLLLGVLLFSVFLLAACAPGPNPATGLPGDHERVAGFWLGIWHGFIAPFVFWVSLFKGNLGIYEVHNNGAWYNLGYLFGLTCILGGGGNRARRQK